MKFFVALGALVGLVSASHCQIISEDFNRPDGVVGNGWMTWHNTSIPGDGEIRIESGHLRAPGAFHREGGIFRDGVVLPQDYYFEFDFQTDTPTDGGWDIRFGGDNQPPNSFSNAIDYSANMRFMQFAGSREVRRIYTTELGGNIIEDLPTVEGQKNYSPSIWAHISGLVRADRSSTIWINYGDGSPALAFDFDSIAENLFVGDRMTFSNSNQTYGPHRFDNLNVSGVPELSTWIFVASASLFLLRRKG